MKNTQNLHEATDETAKRVRKVEELECLNTGSRLRGGWQENGGLIAEGGRVVLSTTMSRPELVPTQPLVYGYQWLCVRVKRTGRESDQTVMRSRLHGTIFPLLIHLHTVRQLYSSVSGLTSDGRQPSFA